jgi:hypothetical protein
VKKAVETAARVGSCGGSDERGGWAGELALTASCDGGGAWVGRSENWVVWLWACGILEPTIGDRVGLWWAIAARRVTSVRGDSSGVAFV